ncbi:hypothetical protein [Streptomyces indicus]|uniref:Homeodomain-like domain-containing protein n=1 Tax=Streptomyces indicus TaxID=417292 RepID=A0A1G9IZS2_9ACTN|nr:hypothetical protein [Streptomyces indicus]SDL30374.1 hypothetical protein SAMN05421806_12622 [Streptomyces indicus]
MNTAKLELAAKRYREAQAALDAALDDLRTEAATVLRDGGDVAEVARITGWRKRQVRQLGARRSSG